MEVARRVGAFCAKTARDRDLLRLHGIYPEYGFDRNKGYPTPEHLAALARYGITSEHRKSFAPVRCCEAPAQRELLIE